MGYLESFHERTQPLSALAKVYARLDDFPGSFDAGQVRMHACAQPHQLKWSVSPGVHAMHAAQGLPPVSAVGEVRSMQQPLGTLLNIFLGVLRGL